MQTDYLAQIKKLSIDYGGSFWVYDPNRNVHCPWDFKQEDLDKMKEAGVQWLAEMCNYGLGMAKDPWFHFSCICREHLQIDQDKYIFPPLDKMSPREKENIWNAFLWFIESVYITPRYVDQQRTLWNDMRKDYNLSKMFFKDYSIIYVELLIHHMASVIGIKLGNIAGD